MVHSSAFERDLFSFEIVASVVEKFERHSLTSSCWGRIFVAAVLLEQKLAKVHKLVLKERGKPS